MKKLSGAILVFLVSAGAAAIAQADNEWQLQGMFCHWRGASLPGGGYYNTKRYNFDGQGHWTFGFENIYSVESGSIGGSRGEEVRGSYSIEGDEINWRTSRGMEGVAQVRVRQNNGRITEITVDDDLYASQLCQ